MREQAVVAEGRTEPREDCERREQRQVDRGDPMAGETPGGVGDAQQRHQEQERDARTHEGLAQPALEQLDADEEHAEPTTTNRITRVAP